LARQVHALAPPHSSGTDGRPDFMSWFERQTGTIAVPAVLLLLFLEPQQESPMKLVRSVFQFVGVLLLIQTGAVEAQPAPSSKGASMLTLQMPALPGPVRVTLKPATTALLVSDMIDPTCKSQPRCTSTMVPAIASLLGQARKAGVLVVYSTRAARAAKWLPEVAPRAEDPVLASRAQDRFYNSELDKTLKDKGITTLIITGWKISGSVLYTSVGATLHGYTVVIPVDASLAATDYEDAIGIFQILTQSSANAKNEPLKAKASTLSRTDMMTFE
jgi:nicotinamidase-related amidase